MKHARIEAVLPHFLRREAQCCEKLPEEAFHTGTIRKQPAAKRSVFRSKTARFPDYVPPSTPTRILPGYIRKHVLKTHVHEMQRSYHARLEEWEKHSFERELDHDIKSIGLCKSGTQSLEPEPSPFKKKPMPIELDRIGKLVDLAIKRWLRQDFKHLVHEHRSVLRKGFYSWRMESHPQEEKQRRALEESRKAAGKFSVCDQGRAVSFGEVTATALDWRAAQTSHLRRSSNFSSGGSASGPCGAAGRSSGALGAQTSDSAGRQPGLQRKRTTLVKGEESQPAIQRTTSQRTSSAAPLSRSKTLRLA